MASNINTTNIDVAYPVAGQDNDSQGFRDNFSTIQNNFVASKAEIEALQSTTAQGVTHNSDDNLNDFNGTIIQDASLDTVTQEATVLSGVNSQTDVNFTNGHYQEISVTADVTLRFALWPGNLKYGKIRVGITGTGSTVGGATDSAHRVTLSTENAGSIKYSPNYPANLDIPASSNPTIIDVWTTTGGAVVYVEYIGQFTP